MIIFLIHGLGKFEGVGEDSRHGNEHVDIQVGSHIYLSVFLNWIIAYALRWGVTHLGRFHYWAIAHLVEGIFFQVQGVFEKTAHFRSRF